MSGTVARLAEIMAKQPSGIGIAAPQIGISKQIAIVDVSSRVSGAERLILVNPVILDVWEPKLSKEGCMSVPDYTAYLQRFNRIRFRWFDEKGCLHEKISEGLEAVCVQHELDHLNGVLFIDRVACLKTDMFPRHLRKGSKS